MLTCFRGVIFVENRLLFKPRCRNIGHICDMSQDENLIPDLYLYSSVSSIIIALILKEVRIAPLTTRVRVGSSLKGT